MTTQTTRRPALLPALLLAAAAFSAAPLVLAAQSTAAPQARKPSAQELEFFEKRVRPVLAENCFSCHSAEKSMSHLRLDIGSGVRKGGERGMAVKAGDPDHSLLIQAVRYENPKLQMPPKGKLSAQAIADLTEWVKMGAPWPEEKEKPAGGAGSKDVFNLKQRAAEHWSWKPVRQPAVPAVKNGALATNAVDRFLLAKLESAGLRPAPEADRRTLIRRVTFDLTGLPPTPEEVSAFLTDKSPNAYRKVVDRLLASPHYGERWARHWLDLMRYSETDGHEFDFEKPGAHEYRDYVIRALNADVPYDQFVKEHVAGDLLPKPRYHPTEGYNESILATGSWWLGEGKHSPVDLLVDEAERVDNQIDVMSKAFLGLTVSCAKCHDHKFDAISQKDYYGLVGFLHSSRYQVTSMEPEAKLRQSTAELERVAAEIESMTSAAAPAAGDAPTLPPGAVVFEDFTGSDWTGWRPTGFAFGPGPRPRAFHLEGVAVQALPGRGVADSGRLADRLQGAIRSETFRISKPKVLFRMAGRGGEINLIIDNFQRIRYPIYGGITVRPNDPARFKWYEMDVPKWVGHRAYIEVRDTGPGAMALDQIVFADSSAPAQAAVSAVAGPVSIPALKPLLDRREEINRTIPAPRWALAMADGTGEDTRLHIRGSTASLGEVTPRNFLEACGGLAAPAPKDGSGRLALADRLVSPATPNTARVIVNRLWQHHFGEGIVRTPDDFGVMGQLPTHPELLDWLAADFVKKGWSLKDLHRTMVLSSAYRMSSKPDPKQDEKDPLNKLLHRMPVRRLEGEAVRDSILAVSGRLDRAMYGPPVLPYLTPFMEGRGKPGSSGPLDGGGRRSIYIGVRRNFLIPMFMAFDFPVPFTTIGKRTVSNVPAQALTMMNNPFVVQQAQVWGKRMANSGKPATDRVAEMYETAFSRPPTAEETRSALEFLAEQAKVYGGENEPGAWSDLAHVLFNVKEFIFLN